MARGAAIEELVQEKGATQFMSAFDHERLLEVGIKVRDLFAADCAAPDGQRWSGPTAARVQGAIR